MGFETLNLIFGELELWELTVTRAMGGGGTRNAETDDATPSRIACCMTRKSAPASIVLPVFGWPDFPGKLRTGKCADLGVGKSNRRKHCKPAACILGLTWSNMPLSLICWFPCWSGHLMFQGSEKLRTVVLFSCRFDAFVFLVVFAWLCYHVFVLMGLLVYFVFDQYVYFVVMFTGLRFRNVFVDDHTLSLFVLQTTEDNRPGRLWEKDKT